MIGLILDSSGLGQRELTLCYEQGMELLGFTKCGKFLD